MKRFYITTAIDYANGKPHLGHAYEKVLADTVKRFKELQGIPAFFLTGLDEHGQKVEQSASKAGLSPKAFCDKIAEEFQGLCTQLNTSHDHYLRTTDKPHQEVVATILQKLFDQGEIYKAEYTGFYSARAEQFLQEKDKVDGAWPEIFGEVSEIQESNYFFRLSKYQAWLIEHIKNNEDFIIPQYRAKQVLNFLEEPLNDLCISRPKSRLSWGIELPFDPDYVTYVWFDALLNYISAAHYGQAEFENYWPADLHIIGKDILLPSHSIYWPIMLKACELALPKTLLIHGWWLASGQKMSKSTGNNVDPLEMIDEYGSDAFRFYFLREMTVGQDSDFTKEHFITRYNSELANDLGNLVSRLNNMISRYTVGVISEASIEEEPERKLKELWENTYTPVIQDFEIFQFNSGLEKTFRFIQAINQYAETRAPWKLGKSELTEDRRKLETSLAYMAEALRLASLLLIPVLPESTGKVFKILGTDTPEMLDGHGQWGTSLSGNTVGERTILFPKPETATA